MRNDIGGGCILLVWAGLIALCMAVPLILAARGG